MEHSTNQSADDRSIGELFAELARELSTLVRQEINLAKTEMSSKMSGIGKNVGFLAAGGLVAYAGFLTLIAALVIILGQAGLPWWASALLVGLIVTGVGGFLVMKAIKAFKQLDLSPKETMETLQEDKRWAKGQMT